MLTSTLPSKTRNTIRRGLKQGVVAEAAPLEESTYERMWALWMEVVQEESAKDPTFKKVADSYFAFRERFQGVLEIITETTKKTCTAEAAKADAKARRRRSASQR